MRPLGNFGAAACREIKAPHFQSGLRRHCLRRRWCAHRGVRNHAPGIASIDLFLVRTISFKLLYGLVILRHGRRRLARIGVTPNPTAEWIAGQVTEAFPWNEAPRHLVRDRDAAFGLAYTRRVRAMGIRDHPTAPRSPWQNGHESGSSDQSGANVAITSSCSASHICATS